MSNSDFKFRLQDSELYKASLLDPLNCTYRGYYSLHQNRKEIEQMLSKLEPSLLNEELSFVRNLLIYSKLVVLKRKKK